MQGLREQYCALEKKLEEEKLQQVLGTLQMLFISVETLYHEMCAP